MNQYFYERACNQAKHLQEQLLIFQNELKSLPSGKLIITQNGKWQKWYHSQHNKLTYIPKSERSKAELLARKMQLEHQITAITQESDALALYLKNHPTNAPLSNRYSSLLPAIHTMPKPIESWFFSDYQQNHSYPEHKKHRSRSGNMLRSKSEVIIDELLHHYNIPFHYEEALFLDSDGTYYPDFTIYSYRYHRFFYWEHFGLMDDPEYRCKALKKVNTYAKHNLLPHRDLILTYETADCPLDYELVDTFIQQFLLP